MESPAMTLGRWVRRSLWHNRRAHAGVVAGVAVAGAILIGALAVGDSVRHSLAKLTEARLEGTHLVLAPAGRFFLIKRELTGAWCDGRGGRPVS